MTQQAPLAPPAGNPVVRSVDEPGRVLAEQLALLCGYWVRTPLPVAVVVASIVYVVWPYASPWLALGWGAATVGVLVARQQLCRRLLRTGAVRARAAMWSRVLGGFGFVTGSLGGASGYLFLPALPPLGQALVTTILGGWGAAAMAANGPYPLAYYAFAAGFFGPVAAAWFVGATVQGAIVGGLLVYFAVMMSLFARELGETAKRSIRIRFENESLIEQLRAANDVLDAARGRAEEANRSKSRFLAAAVHDLSQPLYALNLLVGVLDARAREPVERELASTIGRSVQSLDNLFKELVELARLDAGVIEPASRLVPVRDLVEGLAPEYRAKAAEKGLAFDAHPCDDAILTDPALFERVLRNLLENALRYTERGGVTVTCRRAGDEVAVTVADTGIGIPAAEQARIFDEFYQVGNAARTRRKGLGLGLAIVKRLAERLEHRITVESEPGRGSRFTLHARVGRLEPGARVPDAAAPAVARRPIAGARVLMIDDEPDVLAMLGLLMREWGCEALAAGSLAQARAQLRESGFVPELLLVDFRLADGETGLGAIEALHAELGPVSAIVVTGSSAPEELRMLEAAGFPILHKPVRPEELFAAIGRALPRQPVLSS